MCVLTNKNRKHIEQNFHSVNCQSHAPGWDLWVLGGVKNFSVGICDGAPSTARSSYKIAVPLFGAACAAPNKGTTILNQLIIISPLSQYSIYEVEF